MHIADFASMPSVDSLHVLVPQPACFSYCHLWFCGDTGMSSSVHRSASIERVYAASSASAAPGAERAASAAVFASARTTCQRTVHEVPRVRSRSSQAAQPAASLRGPRGLCCHVRR